MSLAELGYNQISGIAWSGHGRVRDVEVTTDGGKHWVNAHFTDTPQPQCLTRFRMDWTWNGAPTILQSRATDEKGNTQPTRAVWIAQFAPGQGYHQNSIQSWQIAANGAVSNVYA
jgi:sulfane dehydrogenase subunit SoxC